MSTPRDLAPLGKGEQNEDSGTGAGFGRIVLYLTGVSALAACLLTVVYVRGSANTFASPLLTDDS